MKSNKKQRVNWWAPAQLRFFFVTNCQIIVNVPNYGSSQNIIRDMKIKGSVVSFVFP